MATITLQPDALSFSGNLKKITFTSALQVAFTLQIGETIVFTACYSPGAGGLIEIDLREIIEKILFISIPSVAVTQQTAGFADFTATIVEVGTTTTLNFRVIKGGVLDLVELPSAFVDDHFLSWAPQDQQLLQSQPSWLTLYSTAVRIVKCQAYYIDNNGALQSRPVTLNTTSANTLTTIDVSWSAIATATGHTDHVAWDVWFTNLSGTRLSYIQRYRLRNSSSEENMFVWVNTLGGIDSASFCGSSEQDLKIEHSFAEYLDESLTQYQGGKQTETKQSTGYLNLTESLWIKDFFYSLNRYRILPDGSVRPIVLVGSKVVSSTADDLFAYEFDYRYSSDEPLLNLDRVTQALAAPEGLQAFFLTELLGILPTATYSANLLLPIQSPFTPGWMTLSFAQLWGAALPSLIDGTSIILKDGKLKALNSNTGWENSSLIDVSYSHSERKITLTGSAVYFWKGDRRVLISPWLSPAHDEQASTWYLYSTDGVLFAWSKTLWGISDVMVARVVYTPSPAHTFAIREVHETMDERTRQALHYQVGTYVLSGGKAIAGTYAYDTPTTEANTPEFEEAQILDEDCQSAIPTIWAFYTTMRILSSGTAIFDYASVLPFSYEPLEFIQVNDPLTGAMIQGAANLFYNVYQVMVPVTSDMYSQRYRMLFLQPQRSFTSLSYAVAENTLTLDFGNLLDLTPEAVVYCRITYVTSATDNNAGKCRIALGGITYVAGNRVSQITEQVESEKGFKPKHGFESAVDTILHFDDGSLTFSFTGTDIRTWNMGELLLKQTESVEIDDTPALWYLYYKDNENRQSILTASLIPWNRDRDIPIATVDWDGDTGVMKDYRYMFQEVNHGLLTRLSDLAHVADDIAVDASKFTDTALDVFGFQETNLEKIILKLNNLLRIQPIEFSDTNKPAVEDYHALWYPLFGSNPHFRLIIYDGDNELPSALQPVIYKEGGEITRAVWDLSDIETDLFSGRILISR